MKPTPEQQTILREQGNCVVLAAPGSGKTYVLSQKIKGVLEDTRDYQGVIAISFTNKASTELKHRSLRGNTDRKASYFGTIDRFCFEEIVASFGKQVFGYPTVPIQILEQKKLTGSDKMRWEQLADVWTCEELTEEHIAFYRSLFIRGIVLLEHLGICANYILSQSVACRRYLQARYTHIFIDEYQDSSIEQHRLFKRLVELGLTGGAVGDLKQAIFGFARKDSTYLDELWRESGFATHPLTINHRCHPSISNYAKRFLDMVYVGLSPQYTDTDECRVFEKQVQGAESDVCEWLDRAIPEYVSRYAVAHLSEVGILVKSNKNGQFIEDNLSTPAQFLRSTPLDREVSLWGVLFKELLQFVLNEKRTAFEIAERFLPPEQSQFTFRKVVRELNKTRKLFQEDETDSSSYLNEELRSQIINHFVQVAEMIFEGEKNQQAAKRLEEVLAEPSNLRLYGPIDTSKVQIMTIHKSKGLEFDLVFHLDLLEGALPYRNWYANTIQEQYPSLGSDANLHFVAVT